MSAVFAKVVDVHPESISVDCIVSSDNRQLRFVPIISSAISGNTGRVDLPVPELELYGGTKLVRGSSTWETDKWLAVNSKTRDILAVVDFVNGAPVCLGFIAPPVCQLKMPDTVLGLERRIDRHASDVYSWIDQFGNTQWRHPNGTHSSLAGDPSFKELEGLGWDSNWAIKRNKPSILSYFFSLLNNGVRYFALKINPWGKTSLSSKDTIKLTATGSIGEWADAPDGPDAELSLYQISQTADLFAQKVVSLRTPSGTQIIVNTDGTVKITGTSSVTVKSPSVKIDAANTKITGALTVMGMTTATLGLTMGPNASMYGPGGDASSPVQGGLRITGEFDSTATDNLHNHPTLMASITAMIAAMIAASKSTPAPTATPAP